MNLSYRTKYNLAVLLTRLIAVGFILLFSVPMGFWAYHYFGFPLGYSIAAFTLLIALIDIDERSSLFLSFSRRLIKPEQVGERDR